MYKTDEEKEKIYQMKESKITLAEVLVKVNCLDLRSFVRNSIFSTFQGAMSNGGFSIW